MMKHFIISIEYIVPLEKIDDILPEHRKFLQIGYDKEMLLFSGPKNPRTGGIVAARAASLEEIKEYFKNDPYNLNGCAKYDFVEFDPVKSQGFLSGWVKS